MTWGLAKNAPQYGDERFTTHLNFVCMPNSSKIYADNIIEQTVKFNNSIDTWYVHTVQHLVHAWGSKGLGLRRKIRGYYSGADCGTATSTHSFPFCENVRRKRWAINRSGAL